VNIVVDTSVWSLFLRRRRPDPDSPWVRAFRAHVEREDDIFLVGPILQELLAGVRSARDFKSVVERLTPFPLLPLARQTRVSAAHIQNVCRRKGVQAGHVDSLIAAACIEHACPLLTADSDFARIAKHCELVLLPPVGGA